MGTSYMKPSTRSESVNLQEFISGPRHVSFADEISTQSQLSWRDLSGRVSLLGGRLARLSGLSWRSGRSAPRSPTRPWSRVSRKRWSQTTLQDPLLSCKTAWPVSLVESLFLPDFPVRKHCHQTTFNVEKSLGSGAFGKVYRVKHKESGEMYALKIVSKSHLVREGAVGHIRDEVSIQAACGHHPYIVSCPDRWQTRRQLYVLQELVPGGELRDLWLRHGFLHEQLVQLYVAEMAIALDFLHNAGVIFRDLKLENVLLDAQMHVKLIDFGLAKWLRLGGRTQTLCGTLQYMAPEVLELQPYSHSADWWSLGVIAFCLLSGNYPVPAGRDHLETRRLLESSCPALPAQVSGPARALVARLLTAEPRLRLNSLLKLRRQAWFASYDLDAVTAREVSARSIYDTFYRAAGGTSADSESARESDFIDFDATTVDESVGSCGLVDEFPTLAGSPRHAAPAAASVSTPCRSAAAGPELPLSPASGDSVVTSSGLLAPHSTFRAPQSRQVRPPPHSGLLSPHSTFRAPQSRQVRPPPHSGPPRRAVHDTLDGSSSGELLELRLPGCRGCRAAEVSAGDRGGGAEDSPQRRGSLTALWNGAAAGDSVKRPGSWPISRHESHHIWKRRRTAVPSDSEGEPALPVEPALPIEPALPVEPAGRCGRTAAVRRAVAAGCRW